MLAATVSSSTFCVTSMLEKTVSKILIDILRKRNADVRRQQILEGCREGLTEH